MPERLGRYRLVRPISTGGMARVFEARRESLAGVAPRVAIKVILPDFAGQERFRQLFINEAHVGSMLQHQNLVQIQDFDAEGDLYYIVMEFVEGVTVRKASRRAHRHDIPVDVALIAEIGRQVCDGLHHAYSSSSEHGRPLELVHRDIKPSNLMINPQGVIKILDFGISKAFISKERRGAVRGTWGYMSPEQAAGGDVTGVSDLFGLAAVLYEIATGVPLFREKEPQVLRRLLARDEAARRANQLGGVVGSDLTAVLIRALQRDPAARYADAASMGRALARLIPDPLIARDQLVRFHDDIIALANVPAPPSRGSGSANSMAPAGRVRRRKPGGRGLPVAVGPGGAGDEGELRPLKRRQPQPKRTGYLGALAVMASGAAVVLILLWWWRGGMTLQLSGLPGGQRTPEARIDPATATLARGSARPEVIATEPAQQTRSAVEVPAETRPEVVRATSTAAAVPARLPDPLAPVAPASAAATVTVTAAEVAARGALTIGAIPRAQVVVDGLFVRYSPMFNHPVEPGVHTITLIAADGQRTTFKVNVPSGGSARRVWSFETGEFQGEP